jgi:hypothetical protein
MKGIDGSLLMRHEHLTRAVVKLLQMRKIPPGPDLVLHDTPEAFDGIEVVAAVGWQDMQPKPILPVGQCRRQFVRPVDATAVNHHNDLFPRGAKAGHHLMDVLAKPLRIKLGDDLIEDFRGPILDRANDAEQDPTGDAAPRAILHPRLTFEGFFAFNVAAAEGPCGQAKALGLAVPPAGPGEGETPENGLIFIE